MAFDFRPILLCLAPLALSARIAYVGLICNFGQPAKKSKDDLLKFANSL